MGIVQPLSLPCFTQSEIRNDGPREYQACKDGRISARSAEDVLSAARTATLARKYELINVLRM